MTRITEWCGAMVALGTIAGRYTAEIWEKIDDVSRVVDQGSVITVVLGVKVLERVAAANDTYHERIYPFLLEHL